MKPSSAATRGGGEDVCEWEEEEREGWGKKKKERRRGGDRESGRKGMREFGVIDMVCEGAGGEQSGRESG